MSDEAVNQLAVLERQRDALLRALQPDVADAAIAADLAAFDADATRGGVYIADAAARARYEAGRRELYDAARRTEAAALVQAHADVLRTIAETTAAFQRPPVEPNLGLDTMRELVTLTRWPGRTLADVARQYQGTGDGENATFVRLVETDLEALRLRPDPETDATAMMDLRRAIGARQAARVPDGYREALRRAQGLLAGLNTSGLLEHIKTRGVARRPRASTMRVVPGSDAA